MSRFGAVCLALLRIACGVSLIGPGLTKLGWFAHPALDQTFATWSSHPHNALVTKYLALVSPHHAALARVVALGELGLGALLVLGFLTPIASMLAFLMVLNFHFASGQMFQWSYVTGQNGLVYLLALLVLFACKAGLALGLDAHLGRSLQRSGSTRPA